MTKFDLKAFNASREHVAKLNGIPFEPAAFVLQVDDNNIVLAWRDTGTYQGRSYDKYRIGAWYWSNRNAAWQQGNGSLAVPYEQRAALLAALGDFTRAEGIAANLKRRSANPAHVTA